MAVTYAHAAAALAALVDRALGGKEGTPARVAMAAAIGRRYWVLGWRPTPKAPRPLDWHPTHVLGSEALQEDAIVDVWLMAGDSSSSSLASLKWWQAMLSNSCEDRNRAEG